MTFGEYAAAKMQEKTFLTEGVSAVTKNGDEAAKVEIGEFSEKQYEAFKTGHNQRRF